MSLSEFNQVAICKPVKPKRPAPFSIRLSERERAQLEREAGKRPLGAHIRKKLLGDGESRRKPTRGKPPVDYALLGQILGLLGKSELASNLCLMAVAARSGSLMVTDEIEAELKSACADIREIRFNLIKALGVKPEVSK